MGFGRDDLGWDVEECGGVGWVEVNMLRAEVGRVGFGWEGVRLGRVVWDEMGWGGVDWVEWGEAEWVLMGSDGLKRIESDRMWWGRLGWDGMSSGVGCSARFQSASWTS